MSDDTNPAMIVDPAPIAEATRPKAPPADPELLFQNPKFLDILCRYMSNGGSPCDMEEIYQIDFGTIMNWIRQDKERYARYQGALNDRTEWEERQILGELHKLAMSDIRKLFDSDGNILPVEEWPETVAKSVASIEVFEEYQGKGEAREYIGQTKKLKFWDKTKSLELLGKHLKLFTDKREITGTVTLAGLIEAAGKE